MHDYFCDIIKLKPKLYLSLNYRTYNSEKYTHIYIVHTIVK